MTTRDERRRHYQYSIVQQKQKNSTVYMWVIDQLYHNQLSDFSSKTSYSEMWSVLRA